VTAWWTLLSLALAGDLTGRVLDETGQPLDDATVVAYDQRFAYALATTGSDGAFAITGLPPNPYRVRILPPREINLVERYLPDAFDICDGEVFELKRKNVVALGDQALRAGGQISGWLVDSTGQPVADALLTSRPTATSDASQPRYANTDTLGRWVLNGLSLDSGSDYRVLVEVDGWPDQYLSLSAGELGVYDVDLAEAVSFLTLETDAVDLGVQPLLDGVAVLGTAEGPDGPVEEGVAFVYSPSQLVETPIEGGAWGVSGLPPGEVLAWAEADGYATTYFPDTDRPTEAILALTEGEVVENVAMVLPFSARIVGRILGEGDLSVVSVLAYNDDRTVAVAGVVSEDGSFEVEGLHGGDYTLQIFGEPVGLVSDTLRSDDGAPRVLAVPSGEALDLGDLDIPLGAVIEGVAVDAYAGDRIYGAFVYAESQEDGAVVLSATDDKGRYAISGLRKGAYRIWVDYQHYCDADVDWVPRYWPDVVNPVLNGSVRLQAGETLVWDPTLPPDADHDLMDDVWEREVGLDAERDDGSEDPDGDGFSNLEEYQLGTDPLDGSRRSGCGCGGGRGGLFLLLFAPLFRCRRAGEFSRRA